jgi:hypothetical protein
MTSAIVSHALPTLDGKPSYTYDGSFKELPSGVTQRSNGRSESFSIEIQDARCAQIAPSLVENGYCLATNFESRVDLHGEGLDSDRILTLYYPQVSKLLVDALGGQSNVARAIVFDHTIRSRLRKAKGEKETNGENVGGYASRAHNDNTSESAKNRVRLLAKPREEGGSHTVRAPMLSALEAEEIISGRFGIFNVWRHFRSDYPVRDYPLAVLDAQSAEPQDFMASQYIYPDRIGEVVSVLHNEKHRWIYYSEMRDTEALILKVFDSASELGFFSAKKCPPNTAHTSFRLTDSDAQTPARESIECRVLVQFA